MIRILGTLGILFGIGSVGVILYVLSYYFLHNLTHVKDGATAGANVAVALMALVGFAIMLYLYGVTLLHLQ